MKIIYVFILSVISIVVLFLLAKLMGNKQISQLTTFDYIVGITIGSIAAEMATSTDHGFEEPLVAMLCYGLLASLLSVISNRSLKIRRFIEGKTLILFENGKMYKKNFTKAKINLGEFLSACRLMGYVDVTDIQSAVIETNGRISVVPKSIARPPKTSELGIIPDEEKPPVTVIADGIILKENLKLSGNNEKWLMNELAKQGVKSVKKVFFAACNEKNDLNVFMCSNEKHDKDIFS